MPTLTERMPELHQRFASGEGQDLASRKTLAGDFDCVPTTIQYHRRDWVKKGMPGLATGKTDDQAEHAASPAPEPAAATVNQTPADPAPADLLTAEVKLPQEGEVYEGAVERLDLRGRYALVNLTALYDDGARRWIRGKVDVLDVRRDGRKVWNIRDELKEGQLVNVRVVKVEVEPGREPKVVLSMKAAPPHPSEPAPPEPAYEPPAVRRAPPLALPLPALAPNDAPIVANGAEIAAALEAEERALAAADAGKSPEAELAPIKAKAPAVLAAPGPMMVWREQAKSPAALAATPSPTDLCATCAGAKWCSIRHQVAATLIPPAEDLPDHMPGVEVEFGSRPVTKCSAYERKTA